MKKTLSAALLGMTLAALTPAQAQLSVMDIPALPPGATVSTQAAAATSPAATPSNTTATVTTATVTTNTATTTTATSPSDLPTVTTLPASGTALAVAHAATLSGPATVRAGEANTWAFNLTNQGAAAIKLQHGACDVRFEVLNAAGQVVRPDPKNGICTMQLVYTDIAPGQTGKVQNIRWEGKDAQGNPVPAGQYTIRARFNGGNQFSEVAQLTVSVR